MDSSNLNYMRNLAPCLNSLLWTVWTLIRINFGLILLLFRLVEMPFYPPKFLIIESTRYLPWSVWKPSVASQYLLRLEMKRWTNRLKLWNSVLTYSQFGSADWKVTETFKGGHEVLILLWSWGNEALRHRLYWGLRSEKSWKRWTFYWVRKHPKRRWRKSYLNITKLS